MQEPDWEWVSVDSTSVIAHPQAAGQKNGVRRSLGPQQRGLTTKIHAAVDALLGNPVHVHLSGGQEAACKCFDQIVEALPAAVQGVFSDKGYDTHAVVERIEQDPAEVVFPSKNNRTTERVSNENLYQDHNKIE